MGRPILAINRASLGYRPELDGLRAIAVSSVFVFHINRILLPASSGEFYLANGFLGVDIFFVLSGFLITTLLLEEHGRSGHLGFARFYARRALRLLPALFFFLVIMAAGAWLWMPADAAREVYRSIPYAIFYSTNWMTALDIAAVSGVLHHTWSLAIEEQFYLVWPLVLLLLLRLRLPRSLVLTTLVLAIVAICLHRVSLLSHGASEVRLYEGSDTRADSLLVGCAVAMALTWGILPSSRVWKWLLGSLCFASVILIEMFLTGHVPVGLGYGLTLFALAVGITVMQIVHSPLRVVSRLLKFQPLVWIGRLSYSLYLWHIFGITVSAAMPIPLPGKIVASIVLSAGLASFSFYVIERPFLRLKRKFQPPQPDQGTIADSIYFPRLLEFRFKPKFIQALGQLRDALPR